MKKVFGIDLGTTYSCISWVDEHGKPVVIPNAEGELTTPSVVFFESEDSIVVGQAAKDVAHIYPDRVVEAVKRAMGDPEWELEIFKQIYKPQEISAKILQKLANDAAGETGETVEDVVITCPAYFGTNEKEATRQAGTIAGLNVRYVIPEPTAAAIAYGIDLDRPQKVLVYDLGGGTFDVTLIDVREGRIEVIATGGEKALGGKDWDSDIVSYLAQEFEIQTNIAADRLMGDRETYQELLLDAERCKKTLSSRESHLQRVQFESERATVELTRDRFDDITAGRLEQTISLTRDLLNRAASKGFDRIDTLLLVGGSTYMPQVKERVERELAGTEVKRLDPNQIVAKGAALFGYRCQLNDEIEIRISELSGSAGADASSDGASEAVREQAKQQVAEAHGLALPGLKRLVDTEVINVSSKSFGLKVIDPSGRVGVTNMVYVDDQVPRTITRAFQTHEEGQTAASLEVFENSDQCKDAEVLLDPEAQCELLGETDLEFVHALPQGSPIEVTFELTPDGLLKVHGRDLTTHREVRAEFTTKSILSEEAVAAARSRALAMKVS
jgi:molecular chaperone DnaK